MGLLKRSEVVAPMLPEQAVEVPELGGEVAVRGLLLAERLELLDGAAEAQRFDRVARVLACAVRDAAGEPLFTASQWEAFGARHFAAALKLFQEAMRLSGLGAEAEPGN